LLLLLLLLLLEKAKDFRLKLHTLLLQLESPFVSLSIHFKPLGLVSFLSLLILTEPMVKSIDSHRYAHIIGNGRGYTKAYPMERKNNSIYALNDFVKKVGIPEILLCDNDATMEGWNEWKKRIRMYSIDLKYTEP
jgi:hypothetical protein